MRRTATTPGSRCICPTRTGAAGSSWSPAPVSQRATRMRTRMIWNATRSRGGFVIGLGWTARRASSLRDTVATRRPSTLRLGLWATTVSLARTERTTTPLSADDIIDCNINIACIMDVNYDWMGYCEAIFERMIAIEWMWSQQDTSSL